jgi:hypothetical protein
MTPVDPTPKAIRTAHWRPHLPTQDSTFGGHFASSQNGPQTCGPAGPGLSGASPRKAKPQSFLLS